MIKKTFLVFLVIDLLALNVAAFFVIQKLYFQSAATGSSDLPKVVTSSSDNCGNDCKSYIQEQIRQLSMTLKVSTTPTPVVTLAPQSIVTSNKTKVRGTTYVPIPGSGNILQTDWTTIQGTDFYLSKSDFPGLVGVYFEANMYLLNGNGVAYLRLYDQTHNIAVDGSQISTSSQTSTFVGSGAISLWDGYNHYVVQAKSLTADTTVYESGRLKIITEN